MNSEQAFPFTHLKQTILSPPVFVTVTYNPFRSTIVYSDASYYGFGAVLLQFDEDAKLHLVALVSLTLKVAEKRYT